MPGVIENDILVMSVLVPAGSYWWYIIIEKLDQYMPVYLEKYRL